MKRSLIFTLLISAVCNVFSSVVSGDALELKPVMVLRYASKIATRFVSSYH